jgi:hypothetical protein
VRPPSSDAFFQSELLQRQWLTSAIPAAQEEDIRRKEVWSQPGQIVHKTLSQKYPTHTKLCVAKSDGHVLFTVPSAWHHPTLLPSPPLPSPPLPSRAPRGLRVSGPWAARRLPNLVPGGLAKPQGQRGPQARTPLAELFRSRCNSTQLREQKSERESERGLRYSDTRADGGRAPPETFWKVGGAAAAPGVPSPTPPGNPQGRAACPAALCRGRSLSWGGLYLHPTARPYMGYLSIRCVPASPVPALGEGT